MSQQAKMNLSTISYNNRHYNLIVNSNMAQDASTNKSPKNKYLCLALIPFFMTKTKQNNQKNLFTEY